MIFPIQSNFEVDYSEEAIPERDPSYWPHAGTLHEEQTVDDLSAEMRSALIQTLVDLGMSPTRAAFVVRM
jgi:hypothetical protein